MLRFRGISAGFAHQFQCDVISEAPKNSFRSKKLIFRDLERLSLTAPKTTRESTSKYHEPLSTHSFKRNPPEEADQAL